MATQVTNLENPQQLEMAVNGPDGADRLILCTGIAPIAQEADAGNVKQTWTWRVGPVLGRSQFRGAIVQGALIRVSQSGGNANWSLSEMNAYWDEGSGQVAVRAEIRVIALGTGARARVEGISYQVSILAALASDDRPEGDALSLSKGSGEAAGPFPSRVGVFDQGSPRDVSPPEAAAGTGAAPIAQPPTSPGEQVPPLPLQGRSTGQDAPQPPPPPSRPTILEERIPPPPTGTPEGSQPGVTPTPPPPAQPATMSERIPAPPARPTPPPLPSPLPLQGRSTGQGAPPGRDYAGSTQPALVLTPSLVDFGTVPVGGFRAKTLTITNTGSEGSGPLEMVFAGADVGEFTLTVDPVASANLPPGASGHLLISFQPTSPGPKTASLQISTSVAPSPYGDARRQSAGGDSGKLEATIAGVGG